MKTISEKNRTPVLILSGHTIALGVVRSLGSKGVPVYLVSYDRKDMAYKSKYIKEWFLLPHPRGNEKAFVEGLLKIGEKIGRVIVFAADDLTLVTLSKNRDVLKSAFIIPAPGWSVIQNIINKDLTYAAAQRAGVPFPKTIRLNLSAPVNFDVLKEFTFPCLIKPVQSHTYYEIFKTKMAVVNDMEELARQFNECRKVGVDVTVQEIIPGDAGMGFNFNSLFYGGKIQQGFTACKVRMTADGYGIPVVVKSREMIDELREYSGKLLTEIGYEGYSCIEYKFDHRDGIYKLLEVNGRYNRSSLLSVKLGVNFPWMEYNRLVNGVDITPQSYRKGVYYIDEFKDIQVNIRSLLHGKQNIFSFLRPYFSKRVFAVFSYKDPGPFLKHAADGIRLLVRDDRRRSIAACGVPGVVKIKEPL